MRSKAVQSPPLPAGCKRRACKCGQEPRGIGSWGPAPPQPHSPTALSPPLQAPVPRGPSITPTQRSAGGRGSTARRCHGPVGHSSTWESTVLRTGSAGSLLSETNSLGAAGVGTAPITPALMPHIAARGSVVLSGVRQHGFVSESFGTCQLSKFF